MYNSGNSSKNVRGSNIIDGTVETVDIADDAVTVDKLANAINTDIATGVSGSITAGDALPKAGGTMTGLLTVPSLAVTGAATFIDAGAQGPNLSFENIGGSTKFRETTSGNFFYEAWAHYFSKSGGATTLTLTSSNNVEVNTGNLVIGTSGKGIDFSATAGTGTSEVLDDYETGTWTPAITFGGASVGIIYGWLVAKYTKIGNLVTANCYVALTSKGTSTGTAILSGLPFTTDSTAGFNIAASCRILDATFSGQYSIDLSHSNNQLYIRSVSTTGVNTSMTNTNFSNTTNIMMSVTYKV